MKKFSSIMILSMICALLMTSAAFADHFATTDMTWAEFYAGETGQTAEELTAAGLDAVTSATNRISGRFSQLVSSNDGYQIIGVKAVQVRMSDTVYEALKSDTRYTFVETEFDEYKEVSADGSFGAMVSDLKTATNASVTSLSSGPASTWGNYSLNLANVSEITLTSGDERFDLGATLTTSDGKVYGLRHNSNLWFNASTIAFCVNADYKEPHGSTRDYAYTQDLVGKTITKITYILKDQPNVEIDCNVYVTEPTSAEVKVEVLSPDAAKLTVENSESGADYAPVSVYRGSGRGRTSLTAETNYTFENGVLTITSDDMATLQDYTVIFSDANKKYNDISATFNFYYHYATTDMTWAEFYAGEVGETVSDLETAGLDAISTPTTGHSNRFPLLLSAESPDVSGTVISGEKAVQVRMSDDVYQTLKSNSRYKFVSGVFSEYKVVNSDGTFGKMLTSLTSVDATVSLASGASARWGQYQINISGANIDIGLSNKIATKFLGVVLETSDGKKYGMRHDNNLWSDANTIAFCVNENYTEPHGQGTKRDYDYTADLADKTISKITFLIKDAADVEISCNLKVKSLSSATATATVSGDDTVNFTLSDSSYTLSSVSSGSGRNAKTLDSSDYTYSNGVLTITSGGSGSYTAYFTSEQYTDISASFTFDNYYATTDMTWAEFYAGETGSSKSELEAAGLDAVSSSTNRISGRFSQLVASNDGYDIVGVKAVQVRMSDAVYQVLSKDTRYTLATKGFSEYKVVSSDGSFGKMTDTGTKTVNDAVVTLSSGGSATWGNYQLEISGVNITVSSGDTRYDLGATIETSDGKIYGLRHNSNLWFQANTIALSFRDFVEPHGIHRDYDYTSDLEGKTLKKITFILKDQADVVINCDVFLKKWTDATVKATEPETGFLVPLASLDFAFTGVPSDANYTLSNFQSGSGRNRSTISADLYTFANNTLSMKDGFNTGAYRVVFADSNNKYVDLAASFTIYTTDASSLIMPDANNAAELGFLLTPRGAMAAIDKALDDNKLVNASSYTTSSDNYSAAFTNAANIITGSGFSFDIALKNVSSDYSAIVGFQKTFRLTPANCGSDFAAILAEMKKFPVFSYGGVNYVIIEDTSKLKDMGLKVMSLNLDGTSRDITSDFSVGAIIESDTSIAIIYGGMMADSATLSEGEYLLSPEGEKLFRDGVKDDHITATWFFVKTSTSSGGGDTPAPGGSGGSEGDDEASTEVPEKAYQESQTPSATVQENFSEPAVVETVANAIEKKLGASLPSGVDGALIVLPDSAKGDKRDLTNGEVAALEDASEDILVVLETMKVASDGIYYFKVPSDNLEIGKLIFIHMFVGNDSETKSVRSSTYDDEGENAVFVNDNGEVITKVPASKDVNVAAYMEADTEYTPVVTTSDSTTTPSQYHGSGGGGGCNSGIFSGMILALGLALVFKRN